MSAPQSSIVYGKHTVHYRVVETARKTIEIAVHPDRAVVVRVPLGTEPSIVRERVHRRAAWVLRQQSFFRQFEPRTPVRHYIRGETHLYLGRRYRLKLQTEHISSVKLKGKYLHVACSAPTDPQQIEGLLDAWYTRRALDYLPRRFDVCWKAFKKPNLPPPDISIRHMKRRWGSLSAAGRLTLNTTLMRTPRECIDYVITHELCHIVHPDHSLAFWRLLEQRLPDWERRKLKLEMATA